MGAIGVVHLSKTRPHALSRHLDDAEFADRRERALRAIDFEKGGQPFFDLTAMLDESHVDAIDHNQTAEVAQAQLPADFLDRFAICLKGVRFRVAGAAAASAVDVDGNECFGLVKDECASRWKWHNTRVNLVNLSFDSEGLKHRNLAVVVLNRARTLGGDHIEEHLCTFECAWTVNGD